LHSFAGGDPFPQESCFVEVPVERWSTMLTFELRYDAQGSGVQPSFTVYHHGT
jgi:hypothetical protein